MRPGIGKHMHGDADMLKALSCGEIDSVLQKSAVRSADEALFILVTLARAGRGSIKISGKEMERCPDPRDVLKT